MKGLLVYSFTLAVPLILAALVPIANAAKSPAMESCSAEWKKMKDSGKTQSGQTWPKFWSKCAKEYATAHPDEAAGEQDTTPAPATTKKAASAKAAMSDESDTAGSGEEKKQCDAKWASYKSRTGAHGWHDYFQFMAKCM